MANLDTLRQQTAERDLRLEQKIDLITNQLKDNVKSLQSDLPAKIDASAAVVKSEVSDVKKELRDMLVAMTTVQTTMQVGFQNMEKLMALQVKAEVAQQVARGAAGD